jgi:cell division protein FtsL
MAERDSVYRYNAEAYGANAAPQPKAPVKPEKPEEQPPITMKRTEVKSGSLFNIILVSALAFVMLGTVIYSLDRRNTMYSKVSALNTELELAEAENVRLQSELESKMSAKNVEDYAENELGMKKIDSSQIKYIEIQTDDVVSIPKQNEGVLAKVREIFDRCVEYFRG